VVKLKYCFFHNAIKFLVIYLICVLKQSAPAACYAGLDSLYPYHKKNVSSPESWPFKIIVKTLILNDKPDEKNKIFRIADCGDIEEIGIRSIG
jgi:hypothetical protein